MNHHDVYAYGVIAASTLYLLKDNFPNRGGYAEILKKVRNIGGEAANTAIVLARLGINVKLDGNWLNPDGDAQFVQDVFKKNQVDFSRLSLRECQGPKEMLLVDLGTRTIFGTYAQLLEEKSWNKPQKIDIQQAKIVCLDPFFGDESLQAANYAKESQKPIVTVDCKFDDPIFLAADIAIISEEYIGHTYPQQSISFLTREYVAHSNGSVIFTFGHKEIIYGSKNEPLQRFTPYQINPVDTAGAGDSFRAGIIFGLLQEWPIEKMIGFASALAAIVCLSYPGVLNSPSYDEVISFLKDQQPNKFWANK